MAAKSLPPISILRKLVRADSEAGKLYWLERPPVMFSSGAYGGQGASAMTWNKTNAGKEAFTGLRAGYFSGALLGKAHFAHRVIWALHYGKEPSGQIDHINGNKLDNRIANLRDVSQRENRRNCSRQKNNTSGVMGVSWDKGKQKWVATIFIDGRNVFLGAYKDISKAAAARKAADVAHGYHTNHGRDQIREAAQ
jgi:hypothetical protein